MLVFHVFLGHPSPWTVLLGSTSLKTATPWSAFTSKLTGLLLPYHLEHHGNPYPFFNLGKLDCWLWGFQVDGNERRIGDVFQVVCGFNPSEKIWANLDRFLEYRGKIKKSLEPTPIACCQDMPVVHNICLSVFSSVQGWAYRRRSLELEGHGARPFFNGRKNQWVSLGWFHPTYNIYIYISGFWARIGFLHSDIHTIWTDFSDPLNNNPVTVGLWKWQHTHGQKRRTRWQHLGKVCFSSHQLSYEKNPPTFHYTGWFIGILILAF